MVARAAFEILERLQQAALYNDECYFPLPIQWSS